MNTLKPYTDDLEKQLNLHVSLLTKKQHDINESMTIEQESQNSAMEIRCWYDWTHTEVCIRN